MTNDTNAEHELPDDLNLWPNDPKLLFGLAATASRRDLKRAYSRLIRRFKPEHAPDQFRRLREAFEQLDQQLEWREMFEQHRAQQPDANQELNLGTGETAKIQDRPALDSTTENSSISQSSTDENGDALPNNAPEIDVFHPRITSSDADQLWQKALDGNDLKSIYLQLVELVARRPASEIGFARLYWLLTIHPDFEPDRDPSQWLIEGLRTHGLRNRLLPMLSIDVRRRLGRVPAVLISDLLDTSHSAGGLVELAQLRWFAARQLSRFDVIGADLEHLRGRFLDEPDEWQLLLLTVVRQLVLVQSENAFALLARVSGEFESTPANIESNWIWDSFEAILALNNVWRDQTWNLEIGRIHSLPVIDIHGHQATMSFTRTHQAQLKLERLVKLVQKTWESSPLHARADVLSFCATLIENPLAAMNELGAIMQISRPLIHRLLELIREQLMDCPSPNSFEITPAVERILRELVEGELWQSETWQIAVLNFCLKEAVTPNDVAKAIEQYHEGLPESSLVIAESLRFHWPLMCVVEAQRLVWC